MGNDIFMHLLQVLEIVLDLGRPPLARFPQGDVRLSPNVITQQDLNDAIAKVLTMHCHMYSRAPCVIPISGADVRQSKFMVVKASSVTQLANSASRLQQTCVAVHT